MPRDEEIEEQEPYMAVVKLSRCQISGRGVRLFDSEVNHREMVVLAIRKASRRRSLMRDWIHPGGQDLIEVRMSLGQWAGLVSSFGNGSGIPVTLNYFNGEKIDQPQGSDSRVALSIKETKEAGSRALDEITAAAKKLKEVFDSGAGKKEMRAAIDTLLNRVHNGPSNMKFAATSLTEHIETVVDMARADIENIVLNAVANGANVLTTGDDIAAVFALPEGEAQDG